MNFQEQAAIAEATLRLADMVESNPKALELLHSIAFHVFKSIEEQRLRKLHPDDPEESLVDKYFGTGETMGSPTDGSVDWPALMELLNYLGQNTEDAKAYIREHAPYLVESIKQIKANGDASD